ncbi:conserved hypothetical protein [uncultured Desulfobacterium sp.]|uniref:Uncharacterized protein n=1 Tax=uncultured Desulfobacterium sp. TaxID=201089 RepID=A0A445MU32_9BACT|nr:conserved hypothetical protein [uncultured Desulfobacterium sp.]
MNYMKILMDSDCLIKITKAGLKELIGRLHQIFIPETVQKEVVLAGKSKGCEDAFIVEENIKSNVIKVSESPSKFNNGDDALVEQFRNSDYDVAATDDAKLTRRLIANDIPFILPALIIFKLFADNHIDRAAFSKAMDKLVPFISKDEYSTVILLAEK